MADNSYPISSSLTVVGTGQSPGEVYISSTSSINTRVAAPTTLSGDVVVVYPDGDGSNGQVLQSVGTAGLTAWGALSSQLITSNNTYILEQRETIGTGGGANTVGAWVTRGLNTLTSYGGTDVTLGSGGVGPSFLLAVGEYVVRGYAIAYAVEDHITRIYLADSAIVAPDVYGMTAGSGTTIDNNSASWIMGIIDSTDATENYELQHYTTGGPRTDGLGHNVGVTTEVYAALVIIKTN